MRERLDSYDVQELAGAAVAGDVAAGRSGCRVLSCGRSFVHQWSHSSIRKSAFVLGSWAFVLSTALHKFISSLGAQLHNAQVQVFLVRCFHLFSNVHAV